MFEILHYREAWSQNPDVHMFMDCPISPLWLSNMLLKKRMLLAFVLITQCGKMAQKLFCTRRLYISTTIQDRIINLIYC